MSLPLSIVIPTRNEEAYLPRLLQSIKKQTAQPAEIIVADADSDDKTRDIAHSFGCRVVEGGRHPGIGRNKGAKYATQPNILFLDADVQLPEDFLEKNTHEFINRHLSVASAKMIPDSTPPFDQIVAKITNWYFALIQYVLPCANGLCIYVQKAVHEKIGGFDEQIHIAEDWDYAKRASKLGKFRFLNSRSVIISVRRFKKEGRVRLFFKYVYVFLMFVFGGKIKAGSKVKYEFASYTPPEQHS